MPSESCLQSSDPIRVEKEAPCSDEGSQLPTGFFDLDVVRSGEAIGKKRIMKVPGPKM